MRCLHDGRMVAREVGSWAGVDLPVTRLRRQVLVTEPVAGLALRVQFTIDFGTSFYFHREGRGLLLGLSPIRLRLAGDPGLARGCDVGTILLAGQQRFF